MKKLILCCLIAATGSILRAQYPTPDAGVPPLPPGPLLNRAPDFSQWIITFDSSSAVKPPTTGKEEPAPKPKIVVVTKTRGTILEQATDQTGHVVETWRKGGLALTKDQDGKNWAVSTGASGDTFDTTDYVKSDFAGFDWIAPSHYAGIQTLQGRKCIVFSSRVLPLNQREVEVTKEYIGRQIVSEMLSGMYTSGTAERKTTLNKAKTKDYDPNDYLVSAVAYIDFETRLPLLLKYGDKVRSYQYREIPRNELAFPQEAEQTASAYSKYIGRISGQAAPP